MGIISFTYPKTTKSIGGFAIDAFVSEHYSHSNVITDIPVEDGSTVNDHVVRNANEIQIKAFIGKVEFAVWEGPLPESRADLPAEDPKARIKAAYLELLRLHDGGLPVDVVTGLGTFNGMVIATFNIDRAAETGADLPFDMSFKKVRIIKSETATITASGAATGTGDQTGGRANAGVAGTTKPEEKSIWMQEEWKYSVKAGKTTHEEYLEKCDQAGWTP
ncbi:MAG: hypothetical protein LBF74_05910 [Treponema sp.]|jgi:hypothetical protein|nr:hypothetical protein [Treponema sp.]